MKKTVQIISILLICLWVAPAFALDPSFKSMETLREEAKADKKALTAENLKLTDTDGKAFWPIYESYQKDITKVNEKLVNLIKDYAKEYREKSLSDSKAQQLVQDYLALEEDMTNLKKSYLKKFTGVIPAKKVMTYYQLENKIQSIVKFDMAIEIPLAQ
jgi:hypothetical protein